MRRPPAGHDDRRVVIVPVKAFGTAKRRLSGRLDGAGRAALAEAMADAVLRAAAPLPVLVACEDPAVIDWAHGHGATVVRTDGLDLNGSLVAALDAASRDGAARAVIVPADVPFADDLARFAEVDQDVVVVVPDRRNDGTNVLSLPLPRDFEPAYGPGSSAAHRHAAEQAGLRVQVVADERLGWDVDEPEDLDPPGTLGSLPHPEAGPTSTAEADTAAAIVEAER